ncbi:SCO family protein [Noviherbaspirillum cavernae]|nr:SCO family protein [Noviherbaspirillum cavernae]
MKTPSMKNKARGDSLINFVFGIGVRFNKLFRRQLPACASLHLLSADAQLGFLARSICLTFLLAVPLPSRAHEPASAPPPLNSFELPQPKGLQQFALTDHRGVRFDKAGFEGRWTFVLFGYTHCTDVCPATLFELRETRRTLASARSDIATATIFVSVDPQRDTRERLAAYVTHFGEGLRGVHGAPASVKAFAEQFRVRYATAASNRRAAQYVVDHTASVALVGPDARLHAVFMLPLRPEQVAADVARMDARMQTARHDIPTPKDAK